MTHSDTIPRVPLEIVRNIIDIVAGMGDTSTLNACSQTCRTLLPWCRRHIFSSIKVLEYGSLYDGPRTMLSSLLRVLDKNPDICSFIRDIKFCMLAGDFDNDDIPAFLHLLDNVQSFNLTFGSGGKSMHTEEKDWEAVPVTLQSAVLHILNLPTLTTLSVSKFKNFPITPIYTCGGLKELDLSHVQMHKLTDTLDNKTTRPKLFKLEFDFANEAVSTLLSILDFSTLQHLCVYIAPGDDLSVIGTLIETARCSITDIAGEIFAGVSLATSLAPFINRAPLPALRSLTFIMWTGEDSFENPLLETGFCDILENLQEKSNIREIRAEVNIFTDTADTLIGEEWARLDTLLSEEGEFTSLRRVLLYILVNNSPKSSLALNETDAEALLKGLDDMKGAMFTKLSGRKEVVFDLPFQLFNKLR